ncbi:MAG: hypothetical protein KDA22_10855 [Phycisphaerales bacterium]|nr:hypothetical protein [Phycisphaerales bacterium]
MSAAAQQLVDRYRAMPRAMQWGVLAIVGLVVFMLVDSTVWRLGRSWGDQADEMQAVLDDTQMKRASLNHELEATVLAHGQVRMPLPEADGAAALAKAVNEALTRHHALGAVYDSRASSNMPGDSLRGVIAPGQQPARVAGDVRFKAKPQDVAAIVAELESSPDVESISRLTIEKDQKDMTNVRVTMTVEAWVIKSKDARGRGRS